MGEGVSNVQFNRKGQHLDESHQWEREERIKEKVNTHKTSFTKNPTNPNMINPVKERKNKREKQQSAKESEKKMLSDRKAKCI